MLELVELEGCGRSSVTPLPWVSSVEIDGVINLSLGRKHASDEGRGMGSADSATEEDAAEDGLTVLREAGALTVEGW